ncbi:P1 family peptidase [Actinopolymorpha rutila]|uniref:Putative pantetheine hydrolase n=1 Tax=Actinopolymorpha rutila TaxID=446787 RepID=A0A852ZS32_9ACTN|nr:putative pantetheine hydrolase [Actinopolymorpha rutila]
MDEQQNAGGPVNPYGALTDVPDMLVGQVERVGGGWLTGVTAVIPPPGTIGAVDVRGGGPGTHETDALAPGTLVDTVDAVTLAGGSSFGLAAATGVQRWCEEQGRGVAIGPEAVVPVVPAAIVFDLGKGGDLHNRPDADLGYAAATEAASGVVRTGCVGAGTGASFSLPRLKGGVGTASVRLPGGIVVGALVVANAYGSPCLGDTGALLAAQYVTDEALRPGVPAPAEHARVQADPAARAEESGEPLDVLNTSLAVVATNARLTHPQTLRMAAAAHDGLARSVRPVHTLVDGDSIFALATGTTDPVAAAPVSWPGAAEIGGVAAVQAAAADAVTLAMVDAILAATRVRTPAVDLPGYLDRYPSARPPGSSDRSLPSA